VFKGEFPVSATRFAKLKHFRAITIAYDKTARNFLAASRPLFLAAVHLAASAIWLN
jgi:hypothetical protein